MTTRPLLPFLAFALLAGTAHASDLSIALPSDILSTTPGSNRDDITDSVMLNIVEGLVGYTEGGTVAPLLASAVELSDDGLTYTFKLRQGITFHNGEPLTSADVLWNWERYTNLDTQWRCLPDVNGTNGLKVTSVEAPDNFTVVMTLDRPSALFLDTLARTDCAMTGILHSASVNVDGSWNEPIGTGPFELEDWRIGQSVTLARFSDYAALPGDDYDGYVGNKTAYVDKVTFQVVPDAATNKAAVISGSVDIAPVSTADFTELQGTAGVKVIKPTDASKNAILFQTNDPLFGDVKLRQAIAAALDIPQLVAFASDGLAEPNNSAVYSKSSYSTEATRAPIVHDVKAAKSLLAESSYNGEVIQIIANQRAPMPSYQVALVTHQMLQAIGINAEIAIQEWATQLEHYSAGSYQLMSFSYSSRLDPALSFDQFAGDKEQQPRKVWDNPAALELIAEAKVEADPERRQVIFDELHTLMLADTPLILLYNGISVWATSDRVDNFLPWEGKSRLWGVKVAE